MGFLDKVLWGARVWIWLYLLLSIFLFIGVLIFFFRERIRRKYYELRFPEKLINIVMHYKGGYKKQYARLIPDDDSFVIDGKRYPYSNKAILKDNDCFAFNKGGELTLKIDGKTYDLNSKLSIKNRWSKYPEIHYFYNQPAPINFDLSKKSLEFSSKQLEEFKDNDLFVKLLTMDSENLKSNIMMIAIIINIVITFAILANEVGWIQLT